jgi:enamine deaminase RidA (YjgF/YER057c/UK114 family)
MSSAPASVDGTGVSSGKDVRNLGIPAEKSYGYAQAIRHGDIIFVAGQSASSDDATVGNPGDVGGMEQQMRRAYEKIARVLALFDASMDDVLDETLYVTDMPAAVAVAGRVRADVYGPEVEVTSTLCGIQALGTPELLIEIKCTARAS